MMNWKDYRKTADDGKMATMSHPKGHKVQIVKSQLSPVLRKQLDALPLHQSAPEGEVADPNAGGEQSQQLPKGINININTTPQAPPASDALSTARFGVPPDDSFALPKPQPSVAENVGVPLAADTAAPRSVDAMRMERAMPAQPAAAPPPAAQPEAAPQGLAQPQAPAGSAPGQSFADLMDPQKAIQGQIAGIQGSAAAQTEGLETEKQDYDSNELQERIATSNFQKNAQEMQQEIAGIVQDAKDNNISANHYMESGGALRKISTAIGLILGGISSGKTGQPNPALAFLNAQMDRDLAAQKAEAENKHNLLSALNEKYKNSMVAENMFRVSRAAILADQIKAAAATSGSQQAMFAAQQATNALKLQSMPYYYQAVAMQGLNQPDMPATKRLALMQRAGLIKEDQYKSGNEEISQAEKTKTAHEAVDRMFSELEKEQTVGNRVMNPIQSKQRVQALGAELVPLLMEANPSKRLTEESLKVELAPFIPGVSTSKATFGKLKEGVHRLIDTHAASTPTLEGIGVKPDKYQPQAEVKTFNGHQYQKVKGGWQLMQPKASGRK